MVRLTKMRIQSVSYFQLSNRSLSNLAALNAIDRKRSVGSISAEEHSDATSPQLKPYAAREGFRICHLANFPLRHLE